MFPGAECKGLSKHGRAVQQVDSSLESLSRETQKLKPKVGLFVFAQAFSGVLPTERTERLARVHNLQTKAFPLQATFTH